MPTKNFAGHVKTAMSDSSDSTDYSDSESYNEPKSLTSLLRVASSKLGVTTATLSYHEVRRLVDIDDEEVEAKEDAEDDMAEALVDAAESLAFTERDGGNEVSVEPLQSIALLFDSGDAKALKARLLLALDSRGGLEITAMLVCCDFAREESLGTELATSKVSALGLGLGRLGAQHGSLLGQRVYQ